MNNSSAYNNVLLKPTVQTQAAQASVQKRNYQDDRPPVSFQQNFKDVHDSLGEREEKIAKPTNTKKTAQVDNKSTNTIEKKSPSPTKKVDDKSSREPVSNNEKFADKNSIEKNSTDKNADENIDSNTNNLAEQSSDGQNIDTKKTESEAEGKSVDLKVCADETLSADTLVADMLLTNTNVPTPQQPVASPTKVALAPVSTESEQTIASAQAQVEGTSALVEVEQALAPAPVKVEEALAASVEGDDVLAVIPAANEAKTQVETVETKTQVQTKSEIPASATSDSSVIDSNPALAETAKNDIAGFNKQTKAGEPKSDSNEEKPVAANVDATTTIAQALVTNTSLPQTASSVVTPEIVAEQAPVVLAAVGSAVLPKPALAQTKVAPNADNTVDVDVSGTLVSSLATEKQSIKTAVGDLNVASVPDTASAQVPTQSQAVDLKSTFEKTLQNLILPESSKREETAVAPITASTSPTPSSSTNALDSMLRFNDAQAPAARSFIVQTAVPVPVGQPQWSQAVGEKVLWLAAQNVSAAEIHLNPENLGPMQVKVSVNQEQTTINFTSHHAVVREVLDQNLGRLRDMFSEQGLNLVNVDVSDKSFSRQQGDAKDQKGQAGNKDVTAEEEAPVAMSAIVQKRLVDHYA